MKDIDFSKLYAKEYIRLLRAQTKVSSSKPVEVTQQLKIAEFAEAVNELRGDNLIRRVENVFGKPWEQLSSKQRDKYAAAIRFAAGQKVGEVARHIGLSNSALYKIRNTWQSHGFTGVKSL